MELIRAVLLDDHTLKCGDARVAVEGLFALLSERDTQKELILHARDAQGAHVSVLITCTQHNGTTPPSVLCTMEMTDRYDTPHDNADTHAHPPWCTCAQCTG